MKKIRIFVFMLLLLFPKYVYASEYSITNYNISINVSENNIYDITENYNVIFFENSTFKKKINLRPKVYLTDGKYISYITEVRKMYAPNSTNTKKNSRYYKVTFDEVEASNSKNYKLKYEYNMGKDLDNNSDVIFFNIIDGTNEIISDSISFSVFLPTEISDEDIIFLKNGKVNNDDTSITYQLINGNLIQGTINNSINKDEIYSIQVKLPNGYFTNVIKTSSSINLLLLVLPIGSIVIGISLMKKYKHKEVPIDDNISSIYTKFDSAEMSYIYNGEIRVKDLLTLIIKLANDGYLSIKNYTSSFKIRKEKEYDKDNAAQKIIFDGLFQNKEEIDIQDIEGVFYPYYIDACRTLENKKNRVKLFYQLAEKSKKILLLIIYLGFMFLQIKPLYNLLDSYVFATIISMGTSILLTMIYKQQNKYIKYGMIFSLIALFITECYALIDFKLNLLIYILGMILLLFSLYIENTIPIRTIYGIQKFKEIDLFHLELIGMTEETFEEKQKENPNYFYDMLPYVLIFGINGWWFNKFSNKVEKAPSWYESSEKYSHSKLNEFIEKEIINKLSISVQTTKLYADELLYQAPNKKL